MIKLTKEILCNWIYDLASADGEGCLWPDCLKIGDTDVYKQILELQRVVEHIRNCHNCGAIGWSNCKVYRQELDNHD